MNHNTLDILLIVMPLKNYFFPRITPMWNSLLSSVVSSKTPKEFKALVSPKGLEVCVLGCF